MLVGPEVGTVRVEQSLNSVGVRAVKKAHFTSIVSVFFGNSCAFLRKRFERGVEEVLERMRGCTFRGGSEGVGAGI